MPHAWVACFLDLPPPPPVYILLAMLLRCLFLLNLLLHLHGLRKKRIEVLEGKKNLRG
jgi:hypothetical protein